MPVISYNGYTITDAMFFDKFEFHIDYVKVRIACKFVISAASEAAFITACTSAEDLLRDRYKDFDLNFGGSDEYSFSHSTGNTYLLAVPALTKISDHPVNTNLARAYKFEVNAELPADQSGYSFRREASFSIDFSPARRRTANFRLIYTAGGNDTSRTKYLSAGKTYAASILSGLSPTGTFELISESINTEQEDKITNVTLVYTEILSDEKSGTTNYADIAGTVATYGVHFAQEVGNSPTGGYMQDVGVTISINYSTFVNKETVTEANIEAVWRSSVKPWLIDHAADVLGLSNYTQVGSTYIVQSDRHNFDPTSYQISGDLVFSAPKKATSIVALSEVYEQKINHGVVYQKIWDGLDDTYNTYGMGRRKTIIRTIMVTQLNQVPADPRPLSGNVILLDSSDRLVVVEEGVGTVDASVKRFKNYTKTFVEVYLVAVPKKRKLISKPVITTLGVLAQPGG